MGSQLTKNTSESHSNSHYHQSSSTSNYQSLRSSPVHSAVTSKSSSKRQVQIPKNIVVVNRGPNNPDNIDPIVIEQQKASLKLLQEPLIRPLIPFGQSVVIGQEHPRLSVKPVIEIAKLFDQNLRQAAEFVAGEQQKITERIRLVEQHSLKLSQQYCQEKQRRFNKAVENFGKLGEIGVLLERCETDIEQLLTTFAKLNSALPESLCLENFQHPC